MPCLTCSQVIQFKNESFETLTKNDIHIYLNIHTYAYKSMFLCVAQYVIKLAPH